MMVKRALAVLIGCAAILPFVELACGSKPDRVFVSADASAGGSGGNVGGSGGLGGVAGSGGVSGSGATGGTGGAEAGKPCANNAECDDGNSCSGIEACVDKICVGGTPAADDTPCNPGVAVDAGDAGGVSYVCKGGACLPKCSQDADCDDGDVCTGVETCGPDKVCQKGTPLDCDDKDACTKDECDGEKGCYHPLIDADADGHAADSLGACGDDCDDNDPTVFTGAQELCDNKDNNCNGAKDELAPTWYADCDGDGFAPANAQTVANQCTEPPPPCGGTGKWVTLAPGPGTTDCWDQDPLAHPYTASENAKAWQTKAITGAPTTIDFDYNCDTVEEKRFTTTNVKTTATCLLIGSPFSACTGAAGWTALTVPACGASATFSSCGKSGLNPCTRVTGPKAEECR